MRMLQQSFTRASSNIVEKTLGYKVRNVSVGNFDIDGMKKT